MKRKHAKKPCNDCPYRLSSPVGKWHPVEFQKVLEAERDPEHGSIFACHKTLQLPVKERGLCAGYLRDQKARGYPSIRLRLVLIADEQAASVAMEIDETAPGFYPNATVMCAANGVGTTGDE